MRDRADSAAAPAARWRNCRRGSFILHLPLASHHSITSLAWAISIGGTVRPSVFLGCAFVARQAALKDLTLDHLTNDHLHVCLRKRSQVCVRTFPRAPLLNPSAVMEMSSGASTIATMSYWPSVQKVSLTVAPHFFAISLKASVRFGESLTLRIPWSVKLASMM